MRSKRNRFWLLTLCSLLIVVGLEAGLLLYKFVTINAETAPPDTLPSITWIGGTDNNWATAANWSGNRAPDATDNVVIDISQTINLTGSVTVNSLVLGNNGGTTSPVLNFSYDAQTVSSGSCTIERDFSTAHDPPCGEDEAGYTDEYGAAKCAKIISMTCEPDHDNALFVSGGNLHIYSGGKITHSAGTSAVVGTIKIEIPSGGLYVEAGGSIDASGKGYAKGYGPGTGTGGGYGGNGGWTNNTYGSITNPTQLGSGGAGDTASGGGSVWLIVSGMVLNNGAIKSDGAQGINTFGTPGSGGSGGSVNITCDTFAGSGTVTAIGGTNSMSAYGYWGNGGGGGRIAVNYASKTFAGTITARGGLAPNGPGIGGGETNEGGPGSIFTKATGTNGDLLFDNTGCVKSLNTIRYATISTTETFDNVTVGNLAVLKISSAVTITGNLNVNSNSNLVLESAAQVTYNTLNWVAAITDNGGAMRLSPVNGELTVPAGATYVTNSVKTFTNGNINGTVTTLANGSTEQYKVQLSFTGNLTISSTGTFNVTGKGYSGGAGPGSGAGAGSYDRGGGGGGNTSTGGLGSGGYTGGAAIGSLTDPTNIGGSGGYNYGNGGYAGSGGGAVILNVSGTFTINGPIQASASAGSGYGGGGGAGGSINIRAGVVAGNAAISASGANGFASLGNGGGGSGGKVALRYNSKTYSGTITVKGGTGYYDGGPGCIFSQANGSNGDLTFDNTGTSNVIDNKGYATLSSDYTFDNLTLNNLSTVEIKSAVSILNALTVASTSNLRTVTNANINYGTLNWTANIIDNGGTMKLWLNAPDLIIPAGATYTANTARTYANGTVNGTITHSANASAETYKTDLTFNNDLAINASGAIDVSGKGYAAGAGPGAGTSNAGGTYGGRGGANSKDTYGSLTGPANSGSGGTGATGGGVVALHVSGALTNNGSIKSNGANNSNGGGSGGSVYLTVASLAGSGSITTNGGTGGNGGGGGRIAIIISNNNSFTGTITSSGGTSLGTAGTVYPDEIEYSGISSTSIAEHTASISSTFSVLPINGLSDSGFIWGVDDQLIAPGPVHAYYLNEDTVATVKDNIDSIDGTATGTTVTVGKFGNARVFNGTSSDVINLNTAPLSGSGSFSIFAWIKTSATGARKEIFSSGNPSTSNQGIFLFINASNQVEADVTNTAGPASTVTVTDGNWHYVGVVNNAGVFQIYVDGVASGVTKALSPSLGTTAARIGLAIGSTASYFNGSIDDVAIYNKALNYQDITNLYNSGSGHEQYASYSQISKGSLSASGATLSSDLTDLISGTTYYFKPYSVRYNGDIVYGGTGSFTTTGLSPWEDLAALNVTEHTATIQANSTALNIGNAVNKGLIWGADSLSYTKTPVHAYYFNETSGTTALDSIGNLNGSVTGTTATADGKLGWGRSFNGTSDYIQITRPVQNDFTICAWIKTTTKGNGTLHYQLEPILDSEVGGYVSDFGFGIDSNGKLAFGDGNGTDFTINGATVVTTGAWVHACATRNQTTGLMSLYVNGQPDGSLVGSKTALTANANARIGYGYDVPKYFNGVIDDLTIYDSALSSVEVAELYNNGDGIESYSVASQIDFSTNSSQGGNISADLTDLLPYKQYSFKAYTFDGTNTLYSGVRYFSTSGNAMGSANSVDNITNNSATISSDVTSMRQTASSQKGLIWGTTSDGLLSLSTPNNNYSLDDTGDSLLDSITGTSGTNNGSVQVSGILGSARLFDGSNDYISLPASGFNYNYLTIEAWVNPSSLSSRNTVLDLGSYTSLVPELEIGTCNGGSKTVCVITPSVWQAQAANNIITENNWIHIVYTKNGPGATNKLYVNGVSQNLVTNNNSTYNSTSVAKNIGRRGDSVQYFHGIIDNVRVYNKALSQEEITALYNHGAGKASTANSNVSSSMFGNTTGAFTAKALTGLTQLTTYYFRPYVITGGTTSYGSTTSFTTLADNYAPTVSVNSTSGAGDLYAGKGMNVTTQYSDPDGAADLAALYLQLQNPSGTNVEYYVDSDGTTRSGVIPTAVSGSEYVTGITCDITAGSPTSKDVLVTWHFTPDWDWTRSSTIKYAIKAVDNDAVSSGYDYLAASYKYENRLTFTGSLTVTDKNGQTIPGGGWTYPASDITWKGLKVVYYGTTDVYPQDGDFDVQVSTTGASSTDTNSSGRDISLGMTTAPETAPNVVYTAEIINIPAGGEDVSGKPTYTISIDATAPLITNLTSETYPDANTWYTTTTAQFSWETSDAAAGIGGVWYKLDNDPDTDNTVIDSGVSVAGNSLSLPGIDDGVWYLHLATKDNSGNVSYARYGFKVDASVPDIMAVTGDNNDNWQNVDAGPVISWTDPKSPSGDTYYLTNDGSVPSAANYAYFTTDNAYDLPDQAEGMTTIKVVAVNGAGTSSAAESFIVKYLKPTQIPTQTPTPTITPAATARATASPTPVCIYRDPYLQQCITEIRISDVTTATEGQWINICWDENVPGNSIVKYGTGDLLTETAAEEVTALNKHCSKLPISGSGGTYFYEIVTTYGDHSTTYNDSITFAANSDQGDAGSCKVNLSGKASLNADGSKLSFNFTTDNTTDCRVSYGTTAGELKLQGDLQQGNGKSVATLELGGLSTAEVYYKVSCSNADAIQCSAADHYSIVSNLPETGADKAKEVIVNFLTPELKPTTANFAALTGLVLTLGTITFAFPRIWIMGFIWLFPAKKRNQWGIVYNAATRQPVPFAVLRIYDSNGNYVKETVSDLQGRYSFLLDTGSYTLKVEHQEYEKLEQNILIISRDSQYTDDIVLQRNSSALSAGYRLRKTFGRIFRLGCWVIGIIGLLFSCFALLLTFNIVNLIIVLTYLAQLVAMTVLSGHRKWGLVYDVESGERVGGVFVRALDIRQGRQVDVQLTDEKGRFGFRLERGEYILLLSKAGYNIAGSNLKMQTLPDGTQGFRYTTGMKNVSFSLQKITANF